MPLDLIGVGFGRTGTASLRLALNRLGYPCYHMFEVMKNVDALPHWEQLERGETPDVSGLRYPLVVMHRLPPI